MDKKIAKVVYDNGEIKSVDRKKIKRPFEFLSQIYNIIKQISDSLQENS